MNPLRPALLFLIKCPGFYRCRPFLLFRFQFYENVFVFNVMYLGSCNLQHFPKLNRTCASVCSRVCLFLVGMSFCPLTCSNHSINLFVKYSDSFKAWFMFSLSKCSSVFLPLKLFSVGFSESVERFLYCLLDFWDPLAATFSSWVLLREFTKLTK